MRYVALDIETTDVEVGQGGVVEIAMVEGDTSRILDRARVFHVVVDDPLWNGTHRTFARWSEWSYENLAHVRQILCAKPGTLVGDAVDLGRIRVVSPLEAVELFEAFIHDVFGAERARFAGKNLLGFDIPHLNHLFQRFGRTGIPPYMHRVMDIGVAWYSPSYHDWVPNSEMVLREALGVEDVPHSALEDAKLVVAVLDTLTNRT